MGDRATQIEMETQIKTKLAMEGDTDGVKHRQRDGCDSRELRPPPRTLAGREGKNICRILSPEFLSVHFLFVLFYSFWFRL